MGLHPSFPSGQSSTRRLRRPVRRQSTERSRSSWHATEEAARTPRPPQLRWCATSAHSASRAAVSGQAPGQAWSARPGAVRARGQLRRHQPRGRPWLRAPIFPARQSRREPPAVRIPRAAPRVGFRIALPWLRRWSSPAGASAPPPTTRPRATPGARMEQGPALASDSSPRPGNRVAARASSPAEAVDVGRTQMPPRFPGR